MFDDWSKKVKWEFIHWRQYVAVASYDQEPEYSSEVMGRCDSEGDEDDGDDGPLSVTRFSFLSRLRKGGNSNFCSPG